MIEVKAIILFIITAVLEIIGCYLPYLWLNQNKSPWLLLPATIALAAFVWLLTLHPAATGRVYAIYGGVYIGVAILSLWVVNGIRPTIWDLVGCFVTLLGACIIIFAPKG